MPQMMPLNWTLLMIFFLMVFYLFNNSNYFFINYNPITSKSQLLLKKINWKW